MKRFHFHVSLDDLTKNIGSYSTLFGAKPSRIEADYAKWMLEDPRMNFAISTGRQSVGVNHLGFQVDSADELEGMHAQLALPLSGLGRLHDEICFGLIAGVFNGGPSLQRAVSLHRQLCTEHPRRVAT